MITISPRAKSAEAASAHQLKITLEGVGSPVWRRVLVPSSITLARLHLVIQATMGWTNSHLYEFEVGDARYGLDDDEDDDFDSPSIDARKATLGALSRAGSSFVYRYDFGDDWEHQIDVEEVLPQDSEARYPACVDGEGACPPGDVGGAPGYEHFLAAISDPADAEHDEFLDWGRRVVRPKPFRTRLGQPAPGTPGWLGNLS